MSRGWLQALNSRRGRRGRGNLQTRQTAKTGGASRGDLIFSEPRRTATTSVLKLPLKLRYEPDERACRRCSFVAGGSDWRREALLLQCPDESNTMGETRGTNDAC